MAKRKQIEITGDETAASPDGAPEQAPANSELPNIESPPVSPASEIPAIASDKPAIEPIAVAAPAIEPIAESAPAKPPRLVFKARHKRYALLAASVAIAAALGAVVGAVASGGFSTPLPRTNVAGAEERKAMQISIAHLSKEVASLKTSLENANKAAHSQIAKITERFDRASSDITGSISAPQTTAPLPSPRPAQRAAEAVPSRPPVVKDWSIRETRDGYVYVQGHGDVYQVVPGAPLPGLGPVESITRQGGRWVVTTPRGIIVSMRDRGYFE